MATKIDACRYVLTPDGTKRSVAGLSGKLFLTTETRFHNLSACWVVSEPLADVGPNGFFDVSMCCEPSCPPVLLRFHVGIRAVSAAKV